jgi:hypothetical protein
MTDLIYTNPYMFNRAFFVPLRGMPVMIRYATPGGNRITRSGEIAGTGMKNITVVVASGRLYKIPVSSVLGVEIDTASMRLCRACASFRARNGSMHCTAGLAIGNSVIGTTTCSSFKKSQRGSRNE